MSGKERLMIPKSMKRMQRNHLVSCSPVKLWSNHWASRRKDPTFAICLGTIAYLHMPCLVSEHDIWAFTRLEYQTWGFGQGKSCLKSKHTFIWAHSTRFLHAHVPAIFFLIYFRGHEMQNETDLLFSMGSDSLLIKHIERSAWLHLSVLYCILPIPIQDYSLGSHDVQSTQNAKREGRLLGFLLLLWLWCFFRVCLVWSCMFGSHASLSSNGAFSFVKEPRAAWLVCSCSKSIDIIPRDVNRRRTRHLNYLLSFFPLLFLFCLVLIAETKDQRFFFCFVLGTLVPLETIRDGTRIVDLCSVIRECLGDCAGVVDLGSLDCAAVVDLGCHLCLSVVCGLTGLVCGFKIESLGSMTWLGCQWIGVWIDWWWSLLNECI